MNPLINNPQTPRAIRIIGLLALLYHAMGSAVAKFSVPTRDGAVIKAIGNSIGLALWAFLIWKAWSRPRSWGFGLGIFLLGMIPMHYYLWHAAVADPGVAGSRFEATPIGFIVYEIPGAIAGVCCVALHWLTPKTGPADKLQPE